MGDLREARGDQEAFEAWVRATPHPRCDLARGHDPIFGTGYINPKTALAWDAWKARSALTVPSSTAQTGDA